MTDVLIVGVGPVALSLAIDQFAEPNLPARFYDRNHQLVRETSASEPAAPIPEIPYPNKYPADPTQLASLTGIISFGRSGPGDGPQGRDRAADATGLLRANDRRVRPFELLGGYIGSTGSAASR